MRFLSFVLALAACGNPPVKHPTGGGSGTTTGNGSGDPSKPGKPTGPITLKDVGCPTFTCVYHPGVDQYFTCLAGGAGTCFHFGGTCMPEASCMYDATSRSYKQCTKGAEGLCQSWGGACAPASKCMLDARDNLHRQCEDVSGGACKRFGALCTP